MEQVYMHMKGHGRDHGTSRDLKMMINLHMLSVDMFKIVKGNIRSLCLAYFLIHLIMLIHG